MRFRSAAVAVTACCLATLATAAPAHAAAVVDEDRPKITEKGFDFGTNWDSFGAPMNGGHLTWFVDDGVYVTLTGNLYLKNVGGACARIVVKTFEAGELIFTRQGATHCVGTDDARSFAVSLRTPTDMGIVTDVKVQLEVLRNDGSWDRIATDSHFLD